MKTFYLVMVLVFTSFPMLYSQDSGLITLSEKLSNDDLNGDGKADVIKFEVIEENGDRQKFLLKVNNAFITAHHSYNVDGYKIVDIDRGDYQKEIAVHTPNVNGPDEYIIYKYDGIELKQIGRTYSTTTFNGDGTVKVVTYMPFWDKNDTYVYDRENDELVWVEKSEYDIEIECKVLEEFPVFPVINARGFSEKLKKGQTIKIVKAVHKKDCTETGPYGWGLCDEFNYITDTGSNGWATMEQMMGKIDLPLIP